jgi:hypothetical protein
MRMSAQSAKIEAGEVLLPLDAKWLKDFRNEVLAFPHGSHDDQIDSMSQALSYMSTGPPSLLLAVRAAHGRMMEASRVGSNLPMAPKPPLRARRACSQRDARSEVDQSFVPCLLPKNSPFSPENSLFGLPRESAGKTGNIGQISRTNNKLKAENRDFSL